MGWKKLPFSVHSTWHSGECELTTYPIEELLGTKLRALYQRKKGRDLFDLHYALTQNSSINISDLIRCYKEYMDFSTGHLPDRKVFILNLESKIQDTNFTGDTTGLLRPEIKYDPIDAFNLVTSKILNHL